MSSYSATELVEILEKHRAWLNDEEGGERADLRGADLHGANLCDAYLRGANLCGADLRGTNLRGAILCDANLSEANLCWANLRGADLRGAILCDANLSEANLCWANLRGADLRGANLRDAYLRDADLCGADLRGIKSMRGASGNCSEIKAIQCDPWPVTYTSEHMQIGCRLYTLTEWWDFNDEEIARMDSRALDWWRVWKPILQQIVNVAPAVPGAAEKPEEHPAEETEE